MFFLSWLCLFIAAILQSSYPQHETIEVISESIPETYSNSVQEDPYEEIKQARQLDLDLIEEIPSNMEWYISYKYVMSKYSYILDTPKTIYDYYTDDEIYLIQRTVETECFGQDFNSKCNVANVIFNRINDPNKRFGHSVTEVITSPNQFAYRRKNISEVTKLAVEYAFEIVDNTNGCLAFHSNNKTNKFCGLTYAFTDSIGHHFYKEETEK